MLILTYLLLIQLVYGVFYTKIINTPICSNKLLKFHHIVLLKKTPFMDNQTVYYDMHAIDFLPCGNLFEILLGRDVRGKVRIFYFYKCVASDIHKTIIQQGHIYQKKNVNPKLYIYQKNVNPKLYDKIKKWDLRFNLYNRNCHHFSNFLLSLV